VSGATARRLRDAERRRIAVQLARAGRTFSEIAAHPGPDGGPLYSSKQSAHRAVMDEVRKAAGAPAAELRALELARLDELHAASWPEATNPGEAVHCPNDCGGVLWRSVSHAAVRSVLRTMERRAALAGLDARHDLDRRTVELLEAQVELAHKAMMRGLQRAGLSPDTQRMVLEHVGAELRELDEHG
jgi:hypothetical protein